MGVLDRLRLDGRRAVITGGSRGLGFAIAKSFAEAGADLVLVARDADSLQRARHELTPLGVRIDTYAADLCDGPHAEALGARVLTEIGTVDILVNNVGGRREDIPTEDMPIETWLRFLDLNLTNAVVCTRLFGAEMLRRRWGRVVNIASIAGQIAFRGIRGRHYETAKAALVGFTRAVAADWAPHGVTVNAIAPGVFLTEPNRKWFSERPEFRHDVEERIPLGRLGEPDEIGPLALYLASPASAYMTGAVLVLDGGFTLW